MTFNVKDFYDVECYRAKEFVENQDYNVIHQHLRDVLDKRTFNGLCLEFGVYTGRSINAMALHDPLTTFYGFDSFEGLPEDWEKSSKEISKRGTFATKIPKILDNVELIVGWFDRTLPDFIENYNENVSFLHIDSDLYSSAKTILELLNDKIVNGTLIVFDELIDFRMVVDKTKLHRMYPGWENHEWRALNEWVNKFGRKIEPISRTEYYQSAIKVVN